MKDIFRIFHCKIHVFTCVSSVFVICRQQRISRCFMCLKAGPFIEPHHRKGTRFTRDQLFGNNDILCVLSVRSIIRKSSIVPECFAILWNARANCKGQRLSQWIFHPPIWRHVIRHQNFTFICRKLSFRNMNRKQARSARFNSTNIHVRLIFILAAFQISETNILNGRRCLYLRIGFELQRVIMIQV